MIGGYCQIGANSIIMAGVRTGSNVIIGAGAVVTEDVPDNTLAVGIPARVISAIESLLLD
ncbi:MAG: DapH/DapD/GlmU-related protein [Sediminibacterium sp.]|nr:DapH/DapD/GlmU-related protein [Sediminibacterium sp.]